MIQAKSTRSFSTRLALWDPFIFKPIPGGVMEICITLYILSDTVVAYAFTLLKIILLLTYI